MKLQTLFDQKKVVFSLEIFPPKKTASIQTIYDTSISTRCWSWSTGGGSTRWPI